MASSGLRENVILTKIILTTDGTNGCVKGDTWCQGGFGTSLVQDHANQCFLCNTSCVAPLPCVAEGSLDPLWGAIDRILLEMEGRGVEQDLIPYERQLALENVSVKGWIWCIWPPLWSFWYCAPSYFLWRSHLHWYDDQRCCHGHCWRKGPWGVAWAFPPKS